MEKGNFVSFRLRGLKKGEEKERSHNIFINCHPEELDDDEILLIIEKWISKNLHERPEKVTVDKVVRVIEAINLREVMSYNRESDTYELS